jgi:putative phosphoribosyl transferase
MAKFPEHVDMDLAIPLLGVTLSGELIVPPEAFGTVIFAHGSGSSRHSPRNQFVARTLREHRVGTLLFDLLTEAEEREDRHTGRLRFNIELLARRLLAAARWYHKTNPGHLLGYFGSSTGAAAALTAAAQPDVPIRAVVSRGGRPDLAGPALSMVQAPTLLIVGGDDLQVIPLNQRAYEEMRCPKELRIIQGASHLFEEPGTLEQVAHAAAEWFEKHFHA